MTFASLFSRRRKQLYLSRERMFFLLGGAFFSDEIFKAKEISFLEIFQRGDAPTKKKVMKSMTLKVVVTVHPFR